ncbi:MAG TPA: hypothetical protein ENK55_12575, partial [Actinobacteria bacterium]|nr:hypothetical protein [Actinomycetota bacterium]
MRETTVVAPGWTGDWLNAWLAAIGVTVLCPGATLAWTEEVRPKAVLEIPGAERIAEEIAARLPGVEDLERLVIAEIGHRIPLEEYAEAARRARASGDETLAILTSDLV